MSNLEKVASYYHHIDNGGISLNISKDEYDYIYVEFDSSYFGYPSISTNIYLGDNTDLLTKIGLTFLDAANKLTKE